MQNKPENAPSSASCALQGTLIQHLKEHVLHGNMTSSDVIFYYTTVRHEACGPLRCSSLGSTARVFRGSNWGGREGILVIYMYIFITKKEVMFKHKLKIMSGIVH